MLEGQQVLGRSLPGVHPRLVATGAFAHELDVGVGLGDLTLNVLQSRPGPHQVIVHGGDLSLEGTQLGELGQGRLAVGNLVQSGVKRLQIQQTPLTTRIGFQDVPPV